MTVHIHLILSHFKIQRQTQTKSKHIKTVKVVELGICIFLSSYMRQHDKKDLLFNSEINTIWVHSCMTTHFKSFTNKATRLNTRSRSKAKWIHKPKHLFVSLKVKPCSQAYYPITKLRTKPTWKPRLSLPKQVLLATEYNICETSPALDSRSSVHVFLSYVHVHDSILLWYHHLCPFPDTVIRI